MKKKKLLISLFLVAVLTLSGCGSHSIPYPSEYYVPKVEADETTDSDSSENSSPESTNASSEEELSEATSEIEQSSGFPESIHFLFDTSHSINRASEIKSIHSAANKCAAGFEDRHYYTLEYGRLEETTENLVRSGQYGNGSLLDLLANGGTLPFDSTGLNILTTDLQSETSGSELGRWLVSTGSSGFSFYIFEVDYSGKITFNAFTSTSVEEKITVNDCQFSSKEFLLIAFGRNDLVVKFDETFREKLDDAFVYESCHASLEEVKSAESLLSLTASECFDKDYANITFDNTNYCFGLAPVDTDDMEFTLKDTFVFRKCSDSTTKSKSGVKALLFSETDAAFPAILEESTIMKVQEYDEESKSYQPSSVKFKLATALFSEGLPASDNEKINDTLGGNLIDEVPVFTVSVWHEDLPTGLYAIDVTLTCEASGEAVDLGDFSKNHSASLDEYTTALKNSCVPALASDGTTSVSEFAFNFALCGKPSVFEKLLEFESLADELIAEGAISEAENEQIFFRVIIDNR